MSKEIKDNKLFPYKSFIHITNANLAINGNSTGWGGHVMCDLVSEGEDAGVYLFDVSNAGKVAQDNQEYRVCSTYKLSKSDIKEWMEEGVITPTLLVADYYPSLVQISKTSFGRNPAKPKYTDIDDIGN